MILKQGANDNWFIYDKNVVIAGFYSKELAEFVFDAIKNKMCEENQGAFCETQKSCSALSHTNAAELLDSLIKLTTDDHIEPEVWNRVIQEAKERIKKATYEK